MIVVDSSALANAMIMTGGLGRKARIALGRDSEWTAPQLWKAEVFSAMRGLTLGGMLTDTDAWRAIELIPRLGVESVPLEGLLPRMWRLRHAISAYDAAYVALAEITGATLVTADARLARTAVAYCRLELVA